MPSASENYWNQFQTQEKDIERIYAYLLERGEAVQTSDLVRVVIAARSLEEQERRARLSTQAQLYQPKTTYEVGQRLIFSALNDAEATVTSVRPSENARLPQFQVIQATFDNGSVQEFAASYSLPHVLSEAKPIAIGASDESPDEIFSRFGSTIERTLSARLRGDKELVELNDKWLLRDVLINMDDFALNIIEAAIEQNNFSMTTLELAAVLKNDAGMNLDLNDSKRDSTLFSLDYALRRDARFVDVGPRGETRWYLNRLVPPEVLVTPRVLQFARGAQVSDSLPPELETILAEIQDDNPHDSPAQAEPAAVNLILTYPHRRAGSLPFTEGIRAIFLNADKPMLVTLKDELNNRIPAWVVPEDNYIFGLKSWYDKNKMNPGALLEVVPGAEPNTALLRYQPRREGKSLWVKTAKVENLRLTFGKKPSPVAFKYDEEMLIVADDQNGLDKLNASSYGDRPLELLLLDVFPELVKLGGGASVHAKALYSAVNFAKRVGARAVFSALVNGDAFTFTSGGYFVLQQVAARLA